MATMIIKPYVDKEKDTIGLSDLGMNSFLGQVQLPKFLLFMENI
jgi:hypothetical protein